MRLKDATTAAMDGVALAGGGVAPFARDAFARLEPANFGLSA